VNAVLHLDALGRVLAARWAGARLRGEPLVRLMEAPAGGRPALDAPLRARAVARAARLVPGATCLVRAAALARWLRARGAPAVLRIGVRHEGGALRAHAWVELDGAALGEDPAALRGFALLQAPPPRAAWSP
jgi:hypothetical protein